ncbi:RmlC-like cupin domain-containing protein [Crepidotus variabilis]|uniref:RmlC-like cupin domain-containing protein n=1 Tax=Crepidotus variabilis TaxID=179855 RepID=A0A9P6ENH0_9AGAR|nr:RmlC-like cupin domain-containing protein [Crepidotus variabilis]
MPSTTTSELIQALGLQEHPEGGYYVVTDAREESIPSPFSESKSRQLATSIFYLLTQDRPYGVFHMNKSVTYHVLHHGRVEYTLICPGAPGSAPSIEKVIMGVNAAAGERRMLMVETNVWKRSSLLESEISLAVTAEEKDSLNCLITEVVVPGFDWEDHRYMTQKDLLDLFSGQEKEAVDFAPFLYGSGIVD